MLVHGLYCTLKSVPTIQIKNKHTDANKSIGLQTRHISMQSNVVLSLLLLSYSVQLQPDEDWTLLVHAGFFCCFHSPTKL